MIELSISRNIAPRCGKCGKSLECRSEDDDPHDATSNILVYVEPCECTAHVYAGKSAEIDRAFDEAESSAPERICGKCGKSAPWNEIDPCLGMLPRVANACCGHGNPAESYIQFENGVRLAGFTTIEYGPAIDITPQSAPETKDSTESLKCAYCKRPADGDDSGGSHYCKKHDKGGWLRKYHGLQEDLARILGDSVSGAMGIVRGGREAVNKRMRFYYPETEPKAVGGDEWTALRDLREGAVFETRAGIRAVKTEYHTFNDETQCDCYLLESGECAHFDDQDDTEVRELPYPSAPEPERGHAREQCMSGDVWIVESTNGAGVLYAHSDPTEAALWAQGVGAYTIVYRLPVHGPSETDS